MKWILVALIALCNTLGDVLNAAGMRKQGELDNFSLKSFASMILGIFCNPFVLGGLAALAVSFFALLALLSISNVSFAVPATAVGYLFETLLAKYVLKERVEIRRWLAVTLVAIGVALLAL
jgi:transporter family protein